MVDQSTPNIKTIIQKWRDDCPAQGRHESASAFCRRINAVRNKFNHFANLENGNPANCVLIMGSQPIPNPDYVAPPAAGTADERNEKQKFMGKIPAHDGIDYAGPLTTMNSANLKATDDMETIPRSTIWHGNQQN